MNPLGCTTLRGIRSARTSRGNSSALNRKSCHGSASMISEKRGDCCRTDRPRQVLGLILANVPHDSRNQRRNMSFSVLSLLSASARPRKLREVHDTFQQALGFDRSPTQSAATDGSPAHPSCVMLNVRFQSSLCS